VVFQRIDNIIADCVTHDRLTQKLEKYPTLARFVIVEDALDNYVTKMTSAKDKEENQSTFDRLFGLLEKEYYKGKLIDSKVDAVRTKMEKEYALLTQLAYFEEETKRKNDSMQLILDHHTKDLENHHYGMDDLSARVKYKTDIKETDRLWRETKRHPTNDDFKDLYSKTLVPMKAYQE